MSITDLIVEQLRKGKTVELTGIGTFGSETVAPHHDAATGTYYPASLALTFNPTTRGDESIVAALAQHECVGENVARQMWKNYIDALTDKLQRSGNHQFGDFGTLQRTAEGGYSFVGTEGASLSTGDEQPLEDVKVYHNTPADDPFARFENAQARLEEQRRRQEAERQRKEAEEAERQRKEAEEAERQRKEAEEAERQRKEAEEAERQRKEAAAAAAAAALAASKKEEAHAAGNDTTQPSSDAEHGEENPPVEEDYKKEEQVETEHEDKKKKGKWWLWLLLLLLLLLIGGGAYYYFKIYKPAHTTATTPVEHNGQVARLDDLAFNTDLLQYNERDIANNRDRVCTYMNDYIYSFLAYRHYTNAQVPMMQRVREYAGSRLSELMADRFAVQPLYPYADYVYDNNETQLRKSFASRQRYRVQGELLDMKLLDEMLQKLVDELGLQPDVVATQPVAAPVAPRPQTTAPAPTAPTNVKVEQNSRDGFDIIAGFYIDRAKAARMASRLHELGSDAYIIEKNDMFYVSMGSAKSRTAAEALFKHIKGWYDGDIAIKQW